MNRIERIDYNIKRNYLYATRVMIILVLVGSILEISFILHFIFGTVEYIKQLN